MSTIGMGQSLPHHKLFAESHVAFHQVVHVVDVVAQQQGTFHADAEGEAGVDLRIEAHRRGTTGRARRSAR